MIGHKLSGHYAVLVVGRRETRHGHKSSFVVVLAEVLPQNEVAYLELVWGKRKTSHCDRIGLELGQLGTGNNSVFATLLTQGDHLEYTVRISKCGAK